MTSVELVKLVRRPRTWIAIGLLCGLPALVAAFLGITKVAPQPGEGPTFLSAVLSNGSLYPAAALAMVLPLFLPVSVAVVGGDSVAGEAGSGMLRYLLLRPVGRTRLLVAKLVTLVVFVLIAVVSVALTSYGVGVAVFGSEPANALVGSDVVTSVSGTGLTPADVALRITYTVLYIAVSMLGVGAIAVFLSTVTDSSLGAALGALAFLVTSQVLVTLDAAASVRPYLPTRYWLAWIDFFRQPILWHDIERGLGIQAVYVVVFLAAAWANFATRDITS
ncbi:MAG TPA: ABC transporter permease [Streptosporangiaceae bacterium]|jgi:ABC-2 type transport system permease protein